MSVDEIIKKIDEISDYTEKQWETETQANGIEVNLASGPFSFGGILPCPVCETVGFYGPRISGERKYRACKFCGFWQEAPGESQKSLGPKGYRCIHIYCPNGHEYDWVHPYVKDFRSCKICHTKLEKTDWASDNPHHPFQIIKTQIDNFLSK